MKQKIKTLVMGTLTALMLLFVCGMAIKDIATRTDGVEAPVIPSQVLLHAAGVGAGNYAIAPTAEAPTEETTVADVSVEETPEATTETTTEETEAPTEKAPDSNVLGDYVPRTIFPDLNSDYTFEISEGLADYICRKSEEAGVPINLVWATCYIESGFKTGVNNAGLNKDGTTDWGLMGINDKYLQYNCDRFNDGKLIDVLNGCENAYLGIQILAYLYDVYDGDCYDVACAYNLGEAGWERKKASEGSWYYGDKVTAYMELLAE